MRVALVTDSTAYLPAELAEREDISVIPLHVVIDGTQRREGIEISTAEVAAALRRNTAVSTSRPTPQAFLERYEQVAAETGADAIVSVHISAEMSGTVESAQLAAQQAPVPVEVVDSQVLGMAMGYAVLSAARVARAGGGRAQVARAARTRAAAAHTVFYVDTLEFLRRGGRIGMASSWLGAALAIKPLLTLTDGHIEPLEKVRTATRALARLEERALGAVSDMDTEHGVDIAVHHLDSAARADSLTQRLRERVAPARTVELLELGAVVGAHVGPGTIAVVVSPRSAGDDPHAAGGPPAGTG